jgi:pimeloyl-ACP methyl ester carboxylesterase
MHKCEPGILQTEGSWLALTWHEGHQAAGDPVLLLGPPGCEGERSHRCLSLLAIRLAAHGTSVLHLDVGGSGDSAGEMGDFGPADWEADAVLGLDEVLRRAQAERAVVCGFRLGCRIAMPLASHPAVSALVLWEPVLSGAHQLTQWMDAERRMLSAVGEVQQLSTGGFPTSCLGQAIPESLALAMNAWKEPAPIAHCPVWWMSMGHHAPRWATRIACPGPRFWEADPTERSTPQAMIGHVAHAIHGTMGRR